MAHDLSPTSKMHFESSYTSRDSLRAQQCAMLVSAGGIARSGRWIKDGYIMPPVRLTTKPHLILFLARLFAEFSLHFLR
jgi:hypothetical protein